MRRNRNVTALTLGSVWLTVMCMSACDGKKIDAGQDDPLPTYRWTGNVSNSFDEPCPFPIPDAYRGVWEGEFESQAFPSGSKKIRVDVQGLGEVGLCGSITFGDGEPPVLPSDARDAYAPGLPGDAETYQFSTQSRNNIVEGFPYEFGRGESNFEGVPTIDEIPDPTMRWELRFGIRQPYKSWCNLQTAYPRVTPYASGDYVDYKCIQGEAGQKKSGECFVMPWDGTSMRVDVSCTQFTLCGGFFCNCDENGCTVPKGANDLPAKITFTPGAIDGTIDLDMDTGLDNPLAFHLTRVEP